ncbi:MAG: nitroreductase [Aeromicrobium sp.]|nr:nitroreductase [Aeromicrobium sp.]
MSDFNDRIIAEFRANNGHVETMGFGDSLVIMHTTGAKSGQPRETPALAIPDGDAWLVAASKAGAPDNPAWYYNFVAHPEASIETGTETVDVQAIDLQGQERDEAWAKFVNQSGAFAEYEEKAGDRVIPVIKLVRR